MLWPHLAGHPGVGPHMGGQFATFPGCAVTHMSYKTSSRNANFVAHIFQPGLKRTVRNIKRPKIITVVGIAQLVFDPCCLHLMSFKATSLQDGSACSNNYLPWLVFVDILPMMHMTRQLNKVGGYPVRMSKILHYKVSIMLWKHGMETSYQLETVRNASTLLV
jgi:hypothetical protein